MAIAYGILGKVRGKLGNVVLRVDHGKTIASEYNPQRYDAKSTAQLESRARLATANAVSRLFNHAAIAGLSPLPAVARREFVSLAYRSTSVEEQEGGGIIATLNPSKLEFSRGAKQMVDKSAFRASSLTSTEVQASIQASPTSEMMRFILIVWCKENVGNTFFSGASVISTERDSTSNMVATITLDSTKLLSGIQVYGYVVPVIPNTLGKRAIYGDLKFERSSNALTAEVAIALTRADMYGATSYLTPITL